LLLLLTCAGCEFAKQQTFSIHVRNTTSQPAMLWLTKEGPPPEAGWESPEAMALRGARSTEPLPGVIVPAGQQATATVRGNFYRNTFAMLRVYVGVTDLDSILATGPRNRDRVDVELAPGENRFRIEAGPPVKVVPAN
jgi:hypothetical protein